MATVWITVLIFGVLALEAGSQKIYSAWCSPVDQLFAFPGNCNKFLSCAGMGLVEMDCPSNLAFDVNRQQCDYPNFVAGCNNEPKTTCNPNPCVNGTCVVDNTKPRGYECVCQPGITGPSCLDDINECGSNSGPCVRGTCVNTYGSFVCDCGDNGYTGKFCEIPPSLPCINGKPCVNGRCQAGTSTNVCLCSSGFAGELCDSSIVGACSSSPCANGGRCAVSPDGGFTCNCTGTGFTGLTCRNRVTDCRDNLCRHGICESTPDSTGFSCDCRGSGYQGVFCDTPVTGNTTCACVRGTCLSLSSGPFCDCTGTGFTGPFCERQVIDDACFPEACTNGFCVSTGGSYSCNCAGTVYTGPRCDMTACNYDNGMSPCVNNGTCVPQLNVNYTCICPNGFTGVNCELVAPGSNCPRYQCPTDVPRYNYVDWQDPSCTTYYNCDRGSLNQRTCPPGQQFDVVSMLCKSSSDVTAVFCSHFLTFSG
jgi:hypothetical protein